MEFGRAGKSKRTHSTPQEKNIQVVARCRPRSIAEKRSGSQSIVQCNSRKGELQVKQEVGDKTTTKTFTFDKVYGPDSQQIDVYRGVVEPLIEEVLMGYNCTVFAYGQTGTGKTFTMEGERSVDGSLSWEEDPLAGIIPRSLHELFEKIEAQDVSEFSIRVSFLELYNEELFDLLSPGEDSGTKLRIFEDSARKGSVVIHGLEELQVHSKDEVYSILDQGRAKRQTAATLLNAQSSRSHSVFSVTVHIKENSIEGEELLKTGKLNLVDLAGSENISRSGAVDKRAREAGQINQSLLTLGRVITSLVERAPHVPYRESKLTRILQDSLGGRTKTSIIATVSPAMCNVEETLSTLDYAHRAKNITNRPEINQRLTKKALIKEYTDEIERLKKDLLATRDKNGIYISPENYAGMEALIRSQRGNIAEFEAAIAANKDEIAKLNEMFTTSKAELEHTTQQLETTNQRLVTTKESLMSTRRDLYQTCVERDQKTFLLGEHSHTEQALLGQAEQLVEVVEDAIGDVDGLHSKLDRKTRVETSNSAATEKFQMSIEGEFEQMHHNLEEFHSSQEQFCQNLSQRIDEWKTQQQGCVQSLHEGVEGLASLLRLFSQSQTSVVRERSSAVQDSLTQSQTNTKQFQESLFSTTDHLAVTLQPLLTGLSNQLALQSSLLSQSITGIRTQLQSHSEHVSHFVSEQSQKIEWLTSAVHRENAQQQTMMSGHQDAIATALEKQRALSEQLRVSMMAEMEVLLQRTMRHQQEQLGANLALVSMGIRKTAESHQTHTDLLHREFSGVSTTLRGMADTTERETTDMATNMDSMLTQHEKAGGQQEESVQRVRSELDSGVATIQQMTVSHSEDHCTQLQGISTTVTDNKQQLESEMEVHVSTMMGPCSTLHSSLDSMATNGVSQPASQWKDDSASLSSTIGKFADSQRTGIAAAAKTVSQYISEGLAVDLPTGKTPQRREFSYPHHLAQTRPHSDLLRDFQPSITLPPLPESDTEEDEEESTVGEVLPPFDLSQDSSEVESLETTTTSVESSVSVPAVMECKENTAISRHTPAFSKIPARRKYVAGSKSTGAKKRPLTVKN